MEAAESNISKVYEPQKFEKKWYEYWEKNGFSMLKRSREKSRAVSLFLRRT